MSVDIGAELQKAYDEGYADGKRDAAAAIEELQAKVHEKDCFIGMLKVQMYNMDKQLPKHGEWIDRYDEDDKPFFKRKYVCSACGDWNTYGKSDYCPNCGAKMSSSDTNVLTKNDTTDCPKCGGKMVEAYYGNTMFVNYRYCPHCGTKRGVQDGNNP